MTSEERMEICKQCVWFREVLKTCKKCGCFMPIKTKFKSSKCPIRRW